MEEKKAVAAVKVLPTETAVRGLLGTWHAHLIFPVFGMNGEVHDKAVKLCSVPDVTEAQAKELSRDYLGTLRARGNLDLVLQGRVMCSWTARRVF